MLYLELDCDTMTWSHAQVTSFQYCNSFFQHCNRVFYRLGGALPIPCKYEPSAT